MSIKPKWRSGSIIKVDDKRARRETFGYIKSIDGRKYYKTGFGSREDAEKALNALLLKRHMIAMGMAVEAEPVTYAELCKAYVQDARDRGVTESTLANTKTVLERFGSVLPKKINLANITGEHLRKYRTRRLEEEIHPHSIQHELKRIRTVFRASRRLFESRIGSWIPPEFPTVKSVHKGRTVTLTDAQIDLLLENMDGEYHDLVMVGLHTALRINELLQLTRINVDFSPDPESRWGRLHFVSAKSKQEDFLPLTREAAEILQRRLTGSERAFTLSYFAARRGFKRACKAAGIPYGQDKLNGIVIHTLRHSTASYLANLGVPLKVIQRITRHSTVQMVLHYSHPSPEAVSAAIDQISKRYPQSIPERRAKSVKSAAASKSKAGK